MRRLPLFLSALHMLVWEVNEIKAFSESPLRRQSPLERAELQIDRFSFLRYLGGVACLANTALSPAPALAVFAGGTYADAIEVLNAQRLACDNIRDVVSGGNLPEAGFKIKQLNAQAESAGEVALSSLQRRSAGESISVVRYLKSREKFGVLVELCEECRMLLEKALKGSLGSTAAAQIKLLEVIDDTMSAFDDFLAELSSLEMAVASVKKEAQ